MRFRLFTFACVLGIGPLLIPSAQAAQESCTVPLDEKASAPSIDLTFLGEPIDRDRLFDQIKSGLDSSTLEPNLSKIFRDAPQDLITDTDLPYPEASDSVDFQAKLPGTSGLVRARVTLHRDASQAFQMNFSLDTHAALARNALLRKLGYAIPSPKFYRSLKVNFKSISDRDQFLDQLSSETLTSRARWIQSNPSALSEAALSETVGSEAPISMVLQDLVLEPALMTVPQLHWGILTGEVLNSRRSLRALLVPLTLLDVPESVNLYSFETAKIFNEGLVFTRSNASAFKNETTIGDVKWIARRIARFTREDWVSILRAGHYPPDIEALLVEKTLGRVNQLIGLIGFRDFKPHEIDPTLSLGSVVRGKATQEKYEGYALRFTYGDPKSPLRVSELARFFGIAGINSLLGSVFDKANQYLRVIDPGKYIDEHRQNAIQHVLDHFQNHPNEPYVQPIEIWGGPTAKGGVHASRNIITGTYYGSESQIQLVDSVSADAEVGGFFGVSGLPKVGISLTPSLRASRSYVHVRPLPDLKTAWKDSWAHLLVPAFMVHLSKLLKDSPDGTLDGMKAFMDSMKPGELFIVSDSVSGGGSVSAQVPIGALIGFLPSFGSLGGSASLGGQYGVLSRTTLLRTKDGVQVYLQRSKTGLFDFGMDANFLIKLVDLNETHYEGKAHTKAFVFPEKFETEAQSSTFSRDLKNLLIKNNPEDLESDFNPFVLDHKTNGNRFRFSLGPFAWVRRVNFHRIEITPPLDPESRYVPSENKRTVIEGQLTRLRGTDLYGFMGGLLRAVVPILNLGASAKGDDPASNFLGSSRSISYSTQIETTKGRDTRPFLRIEQAFSGWSLRKNRLLRLIRKISGQLLEFNPSGGLIHEEEFAQTKKIQSYRLNWTLLVSASGIDRLLKILNLNETPTRRAHQFLVSLVGTDQYREYCANAGLSPSVNSGPSMDAGTRVESSLGQMTALGCVMPFMDTVYQLRSKLSKHPVLFKTDAPTEDEAREKIRALNQAVSDLTRDLEIGGFIKWVGKENSFFQSRISGFRTHDENGDSDYFSNTIGMVDQGQLAGPLSDLSTQSHLSSNEIEARYLSNGY